MDVLVGQEVALQAQEEICEEVCKSSPELENEAPSFFETITREQKDIFQAQYLAGYFEYLGDTDKEIFANFDEAALEKMLAEEKQRWEGYEGAEGGAGVKKISRAATPDSPDSSLQKLKNNSKIKITKRKVGRPPGSKNKPKPASSAQTKAVSSKSKSPEKSPDPEPVHHETKDATMTAKVRYFRVFSSPLLLIYNFY